jgi:alpha-L-fucosidase
MCLIFIISNGNSFAQLTKTDTLVSKPVSTYKLKYGAQRASKRTDEGMNKWRENRFGQFIHWGLYSIPGGIWKGKTYPYAAEFLKSSAKIPGSTWDSLAYQFNPINYNPTAWARMAKNMGVKYACITTKHHEGFCMWPSKFTDFSIAASPYKDDLIGEFIKAYNKEGIDVYFYYSILDWHNPDWRYDLKTKDDTIAFDRYKMFCKNQLLELQERYPTVKGFWFDGTWDNSWKKSGQFSYEIEMALKAKNPTLIVNSRLRADDLGSRHYDSNKQLMGDYASGYERVLPSYLDTTVLKNDWECCMTIPENQWGFHKDWTLSHIKSPNEILEMLVKCTSLGGNFLLNFGPKSDGTFRDEEVKIANEIGKWMAVNGNVIYGCKNAFLEKQDWGYYTKKEGSDELSLIVFNVPVSKKIIVKLPAKTVIDKAYLLEHSQELLNIEHYQKAEYLIQLPNKNYNSPFVITIKTSLETNDKFHQKALY